MYLREVNLPVRSTIQRRINFYLYMRHTTQDKFVNWNDTGTSTM